MPIILGVVLDERIHGYTLCGEVGNHVWLGNDDLSVQDVVVSVVASVNHKGEVDHKARRVALAIGAGVRLVGRQAVVSEKLVVVLAVNDDTSACAFHLGSEVNPPADEVNLLILNRVGINRERKRHRWPVGVLRILLAAVQSCQKCY